MKSRYLILSLFFIISWFMLNRKIFIQKHNVIEQKTALRKYDQLPCCGVYNKRCDWIKVSPYTIPECEKQNLLKILKWIKSIATVEWGISGGTLLGAAREKGHIPHETDIDITVEKRDKAQLIRDIKARIGETHFVYEDAYLADRIYYSKENRIHVDLWVHEKYDDYTLEITNVHGRGFIKYRMDNSILYPFIECEYDGEMYPCYKEPEIWASKRYGPHWRTPKPKYSPHSTFNDGDDMVFRIVGPA